MEDAAEPTSDHAPPPLTDDELRRLLDFAATLADAAAEITRPRFRATLAVENKAGASAFDPVTQADRAAESAIRARIVETFPRHGILGEEHGYRAPTPEDGEARLTWVLDPIDGTRSFITGIPLWGTLIALNDGRRPILGVADQPFTGERFTGSRLGATLERAGSRRELRTRACAELRAAIVGCTTPDLFTRDERVAFDELTRATRLVRYGADCYAYCMLALGQMDLVVESGLKPYDIQALIPIIAAAGGVVTTWAGGDPSNGGQIIAAADRRAHAHALELLAPAADR